MSKNFAQDNCLQAALDEIRTDPRLPAFNNDSLVVEVYSHDNDDMKEARCCKTWSDTTVDQ